MATTISTVTPFTGTIPNKEQEDDAFDASIDSELAYMNSLPTELNVTIGELNSFGGEVEIIAGEVEANSIAAANSETNAAASESATEEFKDSAEAAAIAAQAGAGLPSGGADGSFLRLVNGTTNEVDFFLITKDTVGLSNVDNTSDLAKPISTATQSALDNQTHDASDITSGVFDEQRIPTASSSIKGGARIYRSGANGYILLSN